jgi:hypothetical protein
MSEKVFFSIFIFGGAPFSKQPTTLLLPLGV